MRPIHTGDAAGISTQRSIGSQVPATTLSGRRWKGPAGSCPCFTARSSVSAVTTASDASALLCFSSLAARLTASPITVYSSRSASPTAPTTTRPEARPAFTTSGTAPVSRRSAFHLSASASRSSTARTASAAKVALGVSAPKVAMMPSPMNLSITPPCRRIFGAIRDWYSASRPMTSPGAISAASRVKPRRSTIRMAASLASPCPGSIRCSAAVILSATSGAKNRARSRAFAPSATAVTSR